MEFRNTYEDSRRATAHDELGVGEGTHLLVFRALPDMLRGHVVGAIPSDQQNRKRW